jgi:DNA polymerase-3 subunit beta
MITVDAKLFVACAQVQSTEDVRYYLNGVYVQPHPIKGALLIATDGHRMMVAHDEEGEVSKAAIIKLPKEAMAFKFKAPTVEPKLRIDADGIATLATYRSEQSTVIDGTFPDWPYVMRPILANAKKRFYGKEVLGAASFNGKYLGSFGAIAAFLKGDKSAPVKVVSHNESDPALVLFPSDDRVFGVLMPMRASTPGNALPIFMKEVLEPSRKTKRRAA